MRTTIDLPDELYRALKIRAASSGVTLRHLVQRLVEQGLRQPSGAARRPGEPPPVIIPARGVPIAAVPRAELARIEEEEDQASMPDLLDASVWVPLSAPDHVHHARARRYWDEEAAGDLAFCRVTALALLRHLTNPRILGDAALDGAAAWRALETWLAVTRVTFLGEPAGVDELLAGWASRLDLRGGHWTDAYLAAFAAASGCRLVAFDGDFARYPGIELLHLEP